MTLSQSEQHKMDRVIRSRDNRTATRFLSWLRGFTKDHPRFGPELHHKVAEVKQEATHEIG